MVYTAPTEKSYQGVAMLGGIMEIVGGGGIIEYWAPIYDSENPVQVFFIILKYLQLKFEGKGEEEYKKFFLSYDNMCHLDSLRLFVVHWKEMPTKEFQQIYSYIIYALGITQVAPETFATAASPR